MASQGSALRPIRELAFGSNSPGEGNDDADSDTECILKCGQKPFPFIILLAISVCTEFRSGSILDRYQSDHGQNLFASLAPTDPGILSHIQLIVVKKWR
jgi:hypothetical protein